MGANAAKKVYGLNRLPYIRQIPIAGLLRDAHGAAIRPRASTFPYIILSRLFPPFIVSSLCHGRRKKR